MYSCFREEYFNVQGNLLRIDEDACIFLKVLLNAKGEMSVSSFLE